MMKRVISFLLAVVLLVGAVPMGAFATETEAAVSDNGMTIEGGNAVVICWPRRFRQRCLKRRYMNLASP